MPPPRYAGGHLGRWVLREPRPGCKQRSARCVGSPTLPPVGKRARACAAHSLVQTDSQQLACAPACAESRAPACTHARECTRLHPHACAPACAESCAPACTRARACTRLHPHAQRPEAHPHGGANGHTQHQHHLHTVYARAKAVGGMHGQRRADLPCDLIRISIPTLLFSSTMSLLSYRSRLFGATISSFQLD